MAIKKNRVLQQEERNKKIKDMDIEEVRHYLCMKNGQNPDKCEGCLGLSTCTAGQRVMVLKAEQGKRKLEEQKAELEKRVAEADGKKETAKRPYGKARSEKARDYIRHVLAAEDPRDYLIQNEGLTSKQARKKLENWRMRHPDLFNGVTWHIKRQNKNPATQHKDPSDAIVESYNEERRKLFEEICQQDSMVQYVMNTMEVDRQVARRRIRYMALTMKDIAEKYDFWQRWENEKGQPTGKKIQPEESGGQSMEQMNGDVSIADFLGSIQPQQETVSDKAIVEKVNTVADIQPAETNEFKDFSEKLNDKYVELAKEKDRLLDRIKWIEKAQEALAMTLNVFNPNSIIGRAVNKGE